MVNLNGTALNIVSGQLDRYINFNGSSSFESGFEVEIIKIWSKKFNFTINAIETDKWSNIIAHLINGSADIGMGDMNVIHERWKRIDFSYPHSINSFTFITSQPKRLKNSEFIYRVFEPNIWILLLISLITIFIILMIFNRFHRIDDRKLFLNLIMVTLSQQMNRMKIGSSFKFVVIYFWIICVSNLILIYSNCIYSYMILPSKVKTIDTLEQLYRAAARSDIVVHLLKNGTSGMLFEESSRRFEPGSVMNVNPVHFALDAINLMLDSKVPCAAVGTRDWFTHLASKYNHAKFYLPPKSEESTLALSLTSIAFRKGFKFKPQFEELLNILKNNGILNHWMKYYKISEDDNVPRRKNQELNLFSFEHFKLYLIILLVGNSMGLIAYLLEYLVYNLMNFILLKTIFTFVLKNNQNF